MGEQAGHSALTELSQLARDTNRLLDEKMVGVKEHVRHLRSSGQKLSEHQCRAESDALKQPVEDMKCLSKQLYDAEKFLNDVRLEITDVTRRPGGAQNRRRGDEGADSGVYSTDSRVFSTSGCLVTQPTESMDQEMERSPRLAETPKAQEPDQKNKS